MEANRTRQSTAGMAVSEAAYAAFTSPRDSPFHNVSVPLGGSTAIARERLPADLAAVGDQILFDEPA